MEVRGGCGYIEEWTDPRLVRDAHLGSIWEGTSNIVALDVIRAIRREDSLTALMAHLEQLLAETTLDDALRASLRDVMARATALANAAVADGGDALARRAASALYHTTTAVAMAWESARMGTPERLHLAQLVLQHRLLPADPLATNHETSAQAENLLLDL